MVLSHVKRECVCVCYWILKNVSFFPWSDPVLGGWRNGGFGGRRGRAQTHRSQSCQEKETSTGHSCLMRDRAWDFLVPVTDSLGCLPLVQSDPEIRSRSCEAVVAPRSRTRQTTGQQSDSYSGIWSRLFPADHRSFVYFFWTRRPPD